MVRCFNTNNKKKEKKLQTSFLFFHMVESLLANPSM